MAARDRLAALRGQQSGTGYSSVPAPQQGRYNPQDGGSYQMSQTNNGNINGGGDQAFYDEISDIQGALRTFNDNVARISDLHNRSLNAMDDQASKQNQKQLESLVEDTRGLSNDLKKRIKSIESKVGSGRDGDIRKQQANLVHSKFVEAIQNYQQVEQQYRQKYKQRMERQFKIVKPDATPEEVRAVVDDDQGGQIFSQALMNSTSYQGARAAYNEVQSRHQDIKKIEKTLTELAQLFNDMSVLVAQQDETIDVIQGHAQAAEQDLEVGLGHTEKAVKSARAARKKRWICFFIILIILIIVGVVVGVEVSNNVHKN